MSESKPSLDSSGVPGKPARISNALLNDASLIGRLLIDQGLADMSQVRQSLSRWKELGQKASDDSLYMVMVNDGVATRQQLEKVRKLAEQQRTMQQIPGYQLLERLGAGAMAVVFKARQLSLDRMVAIKVLPKKFMNDPAFIERFYAEGRAAAKLNHPNIVQAIDVGQAGDFHYFVMEFVEGHTVHDHIEKHTRYPEHEAIRVITQVAEALHHAHQRAVWCIAMSSRRTS